MQTVLNAQNAVAQAERTRRDYELQSERSIAAAEREAELEKQVLSSHPDLIGRLEEGKKTLEKDTQERYKLTNRWFDMSGEDFQKYLSHSTNVNESPVSPIITVVLNGMKLLAQNVQGITIPNSGHWIPEEQPVFLVKSFNKFFSGKIRVSTSHY